MLQVKLDTGFNIEIEFSISPFHKRLFAWFIDLMIQIAYLWGVSKLLDFLSNGRWDDQIWRIVLFLLPFAFYHLACEISMNGQSVGKKAMNIKVMTLQGGQPSLSQYLLRWMFRIIDFPILLFFAVMIGYVNVWIFLFLVAGLLSVIFTPRSQRIGDIVAGTLIIDLKNRTSWEDTVFTEIESDYKPMYPQVMELSDRDINTLKSIVETIRRNGNYELAMKIADRVKSKLKMNSEQESFEFLQTLLKDYNYYTTS